MGKNLVVSEETIRDLLEAHASLSAWYHELTIALRRAHLVPRTPDDPTRAAFAERLAADFPEVAEIARAIQIPRLYVPPSPSNLPPTLGADPEAEDGSTLVEPALARARQQVRAVAVVPPTVPPPDTQDDPGRATPLPVAPPTRGRP